MKLLPEKVEKTERINMRDITASELLDSQNDKVVVFLDSKITADKAKPISLNEYIKRIRNLGFEDDQIYGMIISLLKRGIIDIESTKSTEPTVGFIRYEF